MFRKNKLGIIVIASFVLFSVTSCSKTRYWGYGTPTSQNLSQFISSVRPVKDDVESKFRLAMRFQKIGKHKIAIEELQSVISMEPTQVRAYNAMGVSYDYLGNYDLAIESYNLALKLNPELDYVYNNIGYSYLLRGDIDSAIVAFKKAIAISNQTKKYHNNLALAYARKGQVDQAFQEFKLAGSETRANNILKQLAAAPSSGPQLPDSERKELESVSKNSTGNEKDRSVIISESDIVRSTEFSAPSYKKPIEVASLNSVEKEAAADVANKRYTIQVGVFRDLSYAKRMMEKFAKQDYDRPYISKIGHRGPSYRVRIGSFEKKSEADKVRDSIKNLHGIDAFTAVENNLTEKISYMGSKPALFNSKPALFKSKSRVEISNGIGEKLVAKRVGNYLKEKGVRIAQLTDATHSHYPQSKIFYSSGHFKDAMQLAQALPGFQNFKNVKQFNKMGKKIQIVLVVGKDLLPFIKNLPLQEQIDTRTIIVRN